MHHLNQRWRQVCGKLPDFATKQCSLTWYKEKYDKKAPNLQVFKTTSVFQTFSISKLILNEEQTHQLTNWSSLQSELNLTGLLHVGKHKHTESLLSAMACNLPARKHFFFDCSPLKKYTRYYEPRPIHSEDKQPEWQSRGTGSTLQRLWVLLALHSGWGLNSQQEKTVGSYPHL